MNIYSLYWKKYMQSTNSHEDKQEVYVLELHRMLIHDHVIISTSLNLVLIVKLQH